MTATAATGVFSVGAVFGRSSGILRRNFLVFFLITFGVQLAILLLQWLAGVPLTMEDALQPGAQDPIGSILPAVLGILFYAVSFSALIYGAFRELEGTQSSLGEMLSMAPRRILPLIGLYVVFSIVVGIGLMLLIVPGLWLAARYFVAAAAVVVERKGVFSGMSRSAELTQGYRWPVVGIIAMLFVLAIILGVVTSVINLTIFFSGGPGFFAFLLVVMALNAIFYAFAAVVTVVTYHDLRQVKEGFTATQIAAVFD